MHALYAVPFIIIKQTDCLHKQRTNKQEMTLLIEDLKTYIILVQVEEDKYCTSAHLIW